MIANAVHQVVCLLFLTTVGLAAEPIPADKRIPATMVGTLTAPKDHPMHMPTDVAVTVYEALMAAGAELGLVNAGYRAIETLRLEKGYRAWGSDIGPDHTPVEAGLAWACKMKSGLPFLGREAVAAQLAGGVKKRLAAFTVDDPAVILLGRETIYRDGVRVGWLSSGGFGHTLGKPIGYGYVRDAGGVWAAGWARMNLPVLANDLTSFLAVVYSLHATFAIERTADADQAPTWDGRAV